MDLSGLLLMLNHSSLISYISLLLSLPVFSRFFGSGFVPEQFVGFFNLLVLRYQWVEKGTGGHNSPCLVLSCLVLLTLVCHRKVCALSYSKDQNQWNSHFSVKTFPVFPGTKTLQPYYNAIPWVW